MSFVIYNNETTRTHRTDKRKESWKTEAAAKAEMTRFFAPRELTDEWSIAEATDFRDNIELKVRRKNMMSGKWFTVRVNTPAYMDPSCESYWSM